MEVQQFFKEIYIFEIDRKDRLDSGIAVILTAITGVVVSMVFIIGIISKENFEWSGLVFLFFSVCSFSIAISVIFLVVGFHGRSYKYLDYPRELKEYYDKLELFYKGDNSEAKSEFTSAITRQFIEFGTHNARANDEKSENYFQAKRWFAWSLLPFACGAIVFGAFLVFGTEV
ncbi:hypothetical protein PV773_19450 [Mesorhizobium sp. CC13]|uniref:hypothetical protein n=1 Tax=Mesorhizobium sp. CC13 TaxID=3029194 RepID=UPI003263589B